MGSLVVARCECGLKTELHVGGGRNNYLTTCYFPCRCSSCRKVVQVNLLAKPPACPHCNSTAVLPYDQPELIGVKGEVNVVQWSMRRELGRDLLLTDGLYLCPGCGDMSLRFFAEGLWD